mmetsp:Transcript_15541/g.31443  ORF Transcript_15541/g.31443 Transcript_15541/m.31443 type:complete len:124 (-) Transcript_15541:474-845(-)
MGRDYALGWACVTPGTQMEVVYAQQRPNQDKVFEMYRKPLSRWEAGLIGGDMRQEKEKTVLPVPPFIFLRVLIKRGLLSHWRSSNLPIGVAISTSLHLDSRFSFTHVIGLLLGGRRFGTSCSV